LYTAYTAPQNPPPRLSRRKTCPSANADAGDFLFLVLPSPPKKRLGWGGGAQRARGNEINTAKRDKIGFAPVDPLYYESLTKSTKKMISTSWKLRFDVCHKKVNSCSILMESPLIANGAEISRIDGFVKIALIERQVLVPR
jgi:hypothetical protein